MYIIMKTKPVNIKPFQDLGNRVRDRDPARSYKPREPGVVRGEEAERKDEIYFKPVVSIKASLVYGSHLLDL